MASRFDLIQSRSVYIGALTNVVPALGDLGVEGSIGIGTISPISPLSIYKGPGSNAYIEISGGGSTLGVSSTLFGQGSDLWGYVWNRANQPVIFGTNNSWKMTLSAAGNLAIGTSTPTEISGYKTLTLDGPSGTFTEYRENGTPLFRIGADGNRPFFFGMTNAPMDFYTNGTERMRIAANGNVGIGSSSPIQKLQADGNIFASTGNGGGFILEGGNAILRQSATSMGFNTSGSEKMRIDSSGNVGINTTSPYAKLSINGGVSGIPNWDNSTLELRSTSGLTTAIAFHRVGSTIANLYSDNGSIAASIGTIEVLRIATNYNVGINTTDPIASLDNQGSLGTYRQKNITTMATNILYADGTNATRYEIARATIDYNDWNETGTIEIELYEKYYSDGLKKRYVVSYGWASGSSNYLVEMSGTGHNNMQVSIGAPVVISGDIRYLPIYVDLRYYSRCNAIVKTNRGLTTSNPPGVGGIWFNSAPTINYIADFTPDSTVYAGNIIGGNTVFPSGNVGINNTTPVAPLAIGSIITNSNILYRPIALTGGYPSTNIRSQNLVSFIATNAADPNPFNDTSGEALKNIHIGMVSDSSYKNATRFSVIQGGNEWLTVLGAGGNSGNVGIGTSTPNRKLTVAGEISSNYGSNQGSLWLGEVINQAASFTSYGILDYTLHNGGGYSDIMRIQGDGRIGIGTTNPGHTLTINGAIGLQASGVQKYHIGYYNGGLNFSESGLTDYRLFIKDGGNIGIGTGNPAGLLNIYGTGTPTFVLSNAATTGDGSHDVLIGAFKPGVAYNNLLLDAATYQFKIIGTERMRIALNGNVGIGTTAPSSKLHLSGTNTLLTITDTTYNRTSEIGYLDSANLYLANDSGGNTYIGRYNNVFLVYGGGGSVGIGTTSPLQKLHVTGNIHMDGSMLRFPVGVDVLTLANVSGSWNSLQTRGINMGDWYTNPDYGDVRIGDYNFDVIRTDGSHLLTVANSGNVGIGITNPSYKLDAVGEGRFGTGAKAIIGTDGTYAGYGVIGFGGITNGSNRIFGYDGASDGLYIAAAANKGIQFWTDGTATRMVIKYDGNVGINTGNPGYTLDVAGSIGVTNDIFGYNGNLQWRGGTTFWAGGANIISTTAVASEGVSSVNNGSTLQSGWNQVYYNGTVLTEQLNDGTGKNAGQLVALRNTGVWQLADADDSTSTLLLGICLDDVVANGTFSVLLEGQISIAYHDQLASATPGVPLYVSSGGGNVSETVPTTAGQYVRIVGHNLYDNTDVVVIRFDPDNTWIEL
jgi:hypothetical protein